MARYTWLCVYDYHIVAEFGDTDIEMILNVEGMIKSRRKISAVIHNAQCFLRIIEEFGGFDDFIWSFTDHRIHVYLKHQRGEWEAKNDLSDRVSSELKRRGFKYPS